MAAVSLSGPGDTCAHSAMPVPLWKEILKRLSGEPGTLRNRVLDTNRAGCGHCAAQDVRTNATH